MRVYPSSFYFINQVRWFINQLAKLFQPTPFSDRYFVKTDLDLCFMHPNCVKGTHLNNRGDAISRKNEIYLEKTQYIRNFQDLS
jgi:hypothetical protein